MKSLLLITALSGSCFTGLAQKNTAKIKPAPPAWGHYKTLSVISTAPKKESAAWDSLHFILAAGETTDIVSAKNKPHNETGKPGPNAVQKQKAPESKSNLSPVQRGEVTGNGRKRTPFYLTGKENYSVPEPPANSSLQTRAELDYLLQLQSRRSEEDTRASLYYAGVYYKTGIQPGDEKYTQFQHNLFHIGRSVATWFNADSLPITAKLVARVWMDAEYLIWKYKNHFIRIRPYHLEKKLHNLEETNWAAYPSGHATNSYVNAYLLSALLPEFNYFFIKDAYDMAHSREIIGVHYPSDSESGRLLAHQLVQYLMQDAGFKKDFEAAKNEITAVKKTLLF
jgi:acid phosphatase (class A)